MEFCTILESVNRTRVTHSDRRVSALLWYNKKCGQTADNLFGFSNLGSVK